MLPLQSSVLMCFAKNLLEGKISAGSSKKAPVNRHVSSVRGTAIHQLQEEDVVAPPSAFIASKWMQSTEKTPDFFWTNVALQNRECRNSPVHPRIA